MSFSIKEELIWCKTYLGKLFGKVIQNTYFLLSSIDSNSFAWLFAGMKVLMEMLKIVDQNRASTKGVEEGHYKESSARNFLKGSLALARALAIEDDDIMVISALP